MNEEIIVEDVYNHIKEIMGKVDNFYTSDEYKKFVNIREILT